MKYKDFKQVLKDKKELSDKTKTLYNNGVDLINYNDGVHSIITTLCKEVFGEDGFEMFEWWVYEKKFGEDKGIKAFDKDGKEILKTEKELFNYIYITQKNNS